MTKYLILITILIILYLYWKTQQNQSSSPKPDEIIERKGKQKEIFWDAEDYDLDENSDAESREVKTDNLGNLIPEEDKPILSHKQKRKLKKK